MTTPDRPDADALRVYLRAAHEIADGTRRLLLDAQAGGFDARLKADGSFVTDADLAAEAFVRDEIARRFPDHAVFGEEEGGAEDAAAYTWVVDPIDGTHSFRHGVPLYSTLLALRHGGRSVVGLVDLPGLDRRYGAAEGLGATLNGRPLRLADLADEQALPLEIVATGERLQFESAGVTDLFDRLLRAHRHVRTYCDGFGHGMALEGAVGAMVDPGLKRWDVAATEVLVAEAGGRFVCFGRGTTPAGADRFDVLFGKPRVVDWLLETLGLQDIGPQ